MSGVFFLEIMDKLQEKLNDYIRLIGCKCIYTLENGITIEYTYRRDNFVHLLGLHKLDDILLISMFNDKSNLKVNVRAVISSIKKGKLNDAMVASSAFYHKIKDRYESFSYDNLTTLNYTDAIIDFNASLINSKLKSDYLLFEERPTGEYNHLGIALDSINGVRYAETFIHNTTDMYIKGQTVVKIKNFKIVDKNGNIFIEDSF